MKIIKLTQGFETMVDDEDFERLSISRWRILKVRNRRYARRDIRIEGKCKTKFLHRVILNASDGMQVDHIDGDSLNNQKSNLRLCNHQQNQHAYRARSLMYASKYRGVVKNKKRWQAKISINRKIITLGTFDTEEEAAVTRDKKALELHGEFAQLNFPDLIPTH